MWNPLIVLEENVDFIWNNVGITNLYSSCISTFVDASLVFSWLITENPVQGKSIWQNIPDFVTIPLKLSLIRWFRRKENGRTYSKYDMQWNKKGRSITLHSNPFYKYSYMNKCKCMIIDCLPEENYNKIIVQQNYPVWQSFNFEQRQSF